MILNRKDLAFSPYKDSRGKVGMSGRLQIAETSEGKKYLVKSSPVDVANEYVAHKLAKLIGVPTSDAVLIRNGTRSPKVGIAFEEDFKRVPWDDFLGTEKVKTDDDDDLLFFDGRKGEWVNIKSPEITVAKYPDDDPRLAEFMAYLAFRKLIVLEDNVQLAFAGGHLISYDYAESFYITETGFSTILKYNEVAYPVKVFSEHLFLENGYGYGLNFLHRPNTDFLLDAYLSPMFAFQETDFQPIFDDLDAVFPASVSAFYAACFEVVNKGINRLGE